MASERDQANYQRVDPSRVVKKNRVKKYPVVLWLPHLEISQTKFSPNKMMSNSSQLSSIARMFS